MKNFKFIKNLCRFKAKLYLAIYLRFGIIILRKFLTFLEKLKIHKSANLDLKTCFIK